MAWMLLQTVRHIKGSMLINSTLHGLLESNAALMPIEYMLGRCRANSASAVSLFLGVLNRCLPL